MIGPLRSVGPHNARSSRAAMGHWRFLDEWDGFVLLRDERHVSIRFSTDITGYKWGGMVQVEGGLKVYQTIGLIRTGSSQSWCWKASGF